MPVIGIDEVAQHAPIQSLLEISTRQIFQSSCGEFGTTKDMDQVELKALWLREEQHMDEKIFKDSEWYKHASEITLPALVHWHSIRFTCSRRVDNGIPYVKATKEIQSTPDEIVVTPDEIVVEIAAKPPLAGTAKVVEINATEMNREVLIARARSRRGTWIKDNTKQPRTYTSESLEPNGVFNDKAFTADVDKEVGSSERRKPL